MIRTTTFAILALCIPVGASHAQTTAPTAPVPANPAPAAAPAAPAKGAECVTRKPGDAATVAPGEQKVAKAGDKPVAAENSGILPSAGTGAASAPDHIKQQSANVASPIDCPLPPDHPNALKPGAAAADMPEHSKTK